MNSDSESLSSRASLPVFESQRSWIFAAREMETSGLQRVILNPGVRDCALRRFFSTISEEYVRLSLAWNGHLKQECRYDNDDDQKGRGTNYRLSIRDLLGSVFFPCALRRVVPDLRKGQRVSYSLRKSRVQDGQDLRSADYGRGGRFPAQPGLAHYRVYTKHDGHNPVFHRHRKICHTPYTLYGPEKSSNPYLQVVLFFPEICRLPGVSYVYTFL